jgi:hypothetical protein
MVTYLLCVCVHVPAHLVASTKGLLGVKIDLHFEQHVFTFTVIYCGLAYGKM